MAACLMDGLFQARDLQAGGLERNRVMESGRSTKSTIAAVGVKSEKFRPLKMEVRQAGRVVRVIELPDPRAAYLKAWRALDN